MAPVFPKWPVAGKAASATLSAGKINMQECLQKGESAVLSAKSKSSNLPSSQRYVCKNELNATLSARKDSSIHCLPDRIKCNAISKNVTRKNKICKNAYCCLED
jgi:hypothetical protein